MFYKIKLSTLGIALLCFTAFDTQAYTLSTGAEVDATNLPEPRNKGNGAAAEKWCEEEGKRLPTLEELKEMYNKRDIIGGFTDEFDPGGWPYWSKRVTNNSTGKDFGYRIIFGKGSEKLVDVECNQKIKCNSTECQKIKCKVAKFGEQGDVQYRPFWIRSGSGAYVRCISDKDYVLLNREGNKKTSKKPIEKPMVEHRKVQYKLFVPKNADPNMIIEEHNISKGNQTF